jgi:methionyl-tRNA synthetase
MSPKKFYITTPIYYPNAKPHVGTLYTSLFVDVATRWHALMGYDTFFLTGTDEHGQKLQEAAEAQGKQPKEFIDSIIPAFKNLWQQYEINYSKFIRTTDSEHQKGVVEILQKLIDQGDIYKSTYEGLYCVGCEAFVNPGSDVIKDDKGNQLCMTHRKPLKELTEESYFFRLSAYQDQLLEFYEKHPDFVTPKERLNEVISFVKSGLKDLSISRKSVSWGIPFPGDPSHTVYVWGDALNNYITGIGFGQNTPEAQESFKKWWPADVHVMAKDIVRFHAVHWPAILMAAGLDLPKKLIVHGYILMNEQKMSKSLGNAFDPVQLASWYGVEPVRYYLMRQMAITHDGNFDLKDLEERVSADLANNLGNLLNRMLVLSLNNGLQEIKSPSHLEPISAALKEKCGEAFRSYRDEMGKYYTHVALAECFKFISEINAYFHTEQPWTLPAKNRERFEEVMASVCNGLYAVGLMLWPVMPKKMEALFAALGHVIDPKNNYEQELSANLWNRSFRLKKLSEPLFVKPESHQDVVAEPQKVVAAQPTGVPEIAIDDFAKVQLAVGTILSCKPVDGSDKLLKLHVDCGAFGQRQVLSGVAQHIKPEELIGKQGVYVLNLKPRKMMGMESQGMMLFAEDSEGKLRPVVIDGLVKDGAKVR